MNCVEMDVVFMCVCVCGVGCRCRERWVNVLNPALKRSEWTAIEDEELLKATAELGVGNWNKVAQRMAPRTDNQCWRRWKQISDEKSMETRAKELRVKRLVCAISHSRHNRHLC